MKIRLLGSGTSSGVPRIGNDWGSCDPAEPRNRRTRAAIVVEGGGARVLVDTTPDMREQLLAADIDLLDAVIWTHDHADHSHGIDDLRQLRARDGGVMPGYGRPAAMAVLTRRFDYVFGGRGSYPPTARACHLPDQLRIANLSIHCVDQPHGSITSAGLRFEEAGRAAVYSTDFNVMTPEMEAMIEGVDVWIVDCLRREPHPTHPRLAEVLAWQARLKPRLTVFTHMDNSMDYRPLLAELPDGVIPGHDGLEVEA